MAITLNGTTGISLPNGSASAPAATGTDTDTGIVYGTNTVQVATGGTTAVTVSSAQNVGIGSTSPSFRLTVADTSGGNVVNITNNADADFKVNCTSGVTKIGPTTGVLAFQSDGTTERMRIDSSGTNLIGCTGGGASGNMQVLYGGGSDIQKVYSTQASSPSYTLVSMFSGATTPTNPSGTLRVNILTNGGISNYSANNSNLSDAREKTNVKLAGSYLDKICAIPVKTFNYIDQNLEDDGGLTLGVIAQDVQEVAPELVMESNWGTKEEPKMRLSIYQTDLQYALMKCIQEQQAIITDLKSRIEALEQA
jgi:trimeric autotransporter adhesin